MTKALDAFLELKALPETDDYRYLDPKLLRGDVSAPRAQTPFKEAVVFVVSGGNYIEYQNLVDYARAKGKGVVYGCTDLVNATQFVEQLSRLGQEIE